MLSFRSYSPTKPRYSVLKRDSPKLYGVWSGTFLLQACYLADLSSKQRENHVGWPVWYPSVSRRYCFRWECSRWRKSVGPPPVCLLVSWAGWACFQALPSSWEVCWRQICVGTPDREKDKSRNKKGEASEITVIFVHDSKSLKTVSISDLWTAQLIRWKHQHVLMANALQPFHLLAVLWLFIEVTKQASSVSTNCSEAQLDDHVN